MVRNQMEKSNIGIIKNPTTVKLLAKEIIAASDAYIAKQMDEKHYRELILHYAKYHGKKLFKADGSLNSTIKNRIGSKRCALVELMLEGYQFSIYNFY